MSHICTTRLGRTALMMTEPENSTATILHDFEAATDSRYVVTVKDVYQHIENKMRNKHNPDPFVFYHSYWENRIECVDAVKVLAFDDTTLPEYVLLEVWRKSVKSIKLVIFEGKDRCDI